MSHGGHPRRASWPEDAPVDAVVLLDEALEHLPIELTPRNPRPHLSAYRTGDAGVHSAIIDTWTLSLVANLEKTVFLEWLDDHWAQVQGTTGRWIVIWRGRRVDP